MIRKAVIAISGVAGISSLIVAIWSAGRAFSLSFPRPVVVRVQTAPVGPRTDDANTAATWAVARGWVRMSRALTVSPPQKLGAPPGERHHHTLVFRTCSFWMPHACYIVEPGPRPAPEVVWGGGGIPDNPEWLASNTVGPIPERPWRSAPDWYYSYQHIVSYDVSLWAVAVLFGAYPALAFIRGPVRRWRRRKRGLCIHCGYNLTGLTEPRCPECGRRISRCGQD